MTENYLVFVGTYASTDSPGVYTYHLDMSTGRLKQTDSTIGLENPSFLAIGPEHRTLYAVNEVMEINGQPTGAVSAFSIDSLTGKLHYLNQAYTSSPGPCHLSVEHTGNYVLAANYTGGGITVFSTKSDGQLGEITDYIQHTGSSVDPKRQNEPHPHSIFVDPRNRFAFVPDLGLDKILSYKLTLSDGKLTPNTIPWIGVEPGGGPRHLDFHPSGKYAYLINELNSTFVALSYDAITGTLYEVQTVSTLPENFRGENKCADVHVSPDGRFLYGSNRGHDSIVIYAINQSTGNLTYVDHQSTQGALPRNFAIDPTGTFLLVANASTNTIVTFRIENETGRLHTTNHTVEVPAPVCLKLIPSRM